MLDHDERGNVLGVRAQDVPDRDAGPDPIPDAELTVLDEFERYLDRRAKEDTKALGRLGIISRQLSLIHALEEYCLVCNDDLEVINATIRQFGMDSDAVRGVLAACIEAAGDTHYRTFKL